MRFLATAVLIIVANVACDDGVGPQDGPLRLDAAVGRSTIAEGDTTSLVFRLRNIGADTVELGFPSGCQILPFVTDHNNGSIVHPDGGGWLCLTVITSLTLPPGGVERTVLIRGGGPSVQSGLAVDLPAGEYRAFATLADQTFKLRSADVLFTVR